MAGCCSGSRETSDRGQQQKSHDFCYVIRAFGLAAFIITSLSIPGPGRAQDPKPVDPPGPDLIRRHDWEAAANRAPYPAVDPQCNWEIGLMTAPGYWHSGWPYGPREAPPWGYPGLVGGPFVGYPWGWPYYSGRAGQNWSNGLSLYGPPVPTYGPIPGILGAPDMKHTWREAPRLGIGYGWVGVYAASPRPSPLTVNAWPVIVERMPGEGCPNGPHCATPIVPGAPAPAAPVEPAPVKPEPGKTGSDAPVAGMGVPLILSVKVPQPTAEVFVDGHRTAQTGLDRTFESPPLEPGKQYRYELTARWLEGGQPRQMKKAVVGTPGEVVRVDFTAP